MDANTHIVLLIIQINGRALGWCHVHCPQFGGKIPAVKGGMREKNNEIECKHGKDIAGSGSFLRFGEVTEPHLRLLK